MAAYNHGHPDPMQWAMDGAVNAHLFPDVSSFGLAMRLENEGCEQTTKVNTHTRQPHMKNFH